MESDLVLNRSFPGSFNDSIIFYTPLIVFCIWLISEISETFPKLTIFQKVEYEGIKTCSDDTKLPGNERISMSRCV